MKNYILFILTSFFCLGSSYSQTCNRMADSLALVEIYNAHNGASWNSPWDLTTAIDTWRGVRLNSGGCVQSLSLGEQNFQGTLVDINLPQLETLRLSGCPLLTGPIPDFSGIPNLMTLYLGFSGFTGSIPDFSGIPNLKSLNISGMASLTGSIPDFSNLGQLERLEMISIRGVTGAIPDFNYLVSLKDLTLGISDFAGPIPDFHNMPQIYSIRLNQLDSLIGPIPDFAFIPTLNTLSIGYTNITSQIPDFSNLANLQILFLTNNPGLTGSIPDFSNTPNLVQLGLFSNQLSGQIPDFTLPHLAVIKAARNLLSGTLPNFSSIPKLSTLVLTGNQISGPLPLFDALPLLRSLDLTSNLMDGPIHDFSFNPLLESLDLGNNQFTGTLPDFTQLTLLDWFRIGGNRLEGPMGTFSQNLNLELLNLGWNNFTEMPDLSHLTKMERASVQYNFLSFDDLIPNIGFASKSFDYAPQKTLGQDTLIESYEFQPFRLHIPIDSFLTSNTYTWYKDNTIIATTDSNTFVIPNLALSDSGLYRCEISNAIITDLTLLTAETHLRVFETPCGEPTEISPDSLTRLCLGETETPIILSNNGLLSVVDSNYTYVITDTNDVILEIPAGNSLDFSSYGLGDYRVYGLSYADTLGVETNENIFQAVDQTDCDSISSNFLPVEILPILSNPNFQVNYSMDSLTLTFEADSQSTGITYQWEFGEGSSSMGRIDTFTFPDYGTYEVCLIRTSFCGSDTTCQELRLNSPTNGISDIPSIDFTLLPNPTNSFLSISLPASTPSIRNGWELSILNMQGERVFLSSRINTDEYAFSVADLAPGIYLCYISSSKFKAWKKWIKIP